MALCLAMLRQIAFSLGPKGAGNACVRILHLLYFLKVPRCCIEFSEFMLAGEGHLAGLAMVAVFCNAFGIPISLPFVDSLWIPSSDCGSRRNFVLFACPRSGGRSNPVQEGRSFMLVARTLSPKSISDPFGQEHLTTNTKWAHK